MRLPVPPLSPVIPTAPAPATLALVPVFTVDVPLAPKFPLPARASRSCRHTKSSWDRSTWMSPSSWTSGLLRFRSSCCPSPASPASTFRWSSCPPRRPVRPHGEAPQLLEARASVPGHRETESSTPPPMTTPIALQRPEGSPSGSSSTPTRKPPSAQSAPPRETHGPQLPFGQSRSYGTAGSGTSGGRVPSVPVAAVAAIIAFFILAAPRLGRRLRVARELSPRSTYRSSIDHPG